MKTKILVILACLTAMTATALAGTIRVQNSDSKEHTIELKCAGSSKTVKLSASTTASYTFHSTNNSCDIVGGTITFPTKKLENGQQWKIKDGKATAY